jgi:hypothetical protein
MTTLAQFLPFLLMVSNFLPLEHRSRKQLLSFLAFANFLAMTLGKDRRVYRSRNIIKDLIMLRIMRRILCCFASEELQVILKRLQHNYPHNLEGFNSILCNRHLQPYFRVCISYDFVTSLQMSNFRDRWFYFLNLFPRRGPIQDFEFGFHVLVQEYLTLYRENPLFLSLWNCSSTTLRKRIFYTASRRQTPNIRAFIKSIKRMREALRCIFEFDPSINMYQLSDAILEYFFNELQSMSIFGFNSLFDHIARDALDPSETVQVRGFYDGPFLPPSPIPVFPYLRRNSENILLLCNSTFSLPFISDTLLAESSHFATNKFHITEALLSQMSKGIWFVLTFISLHQRSDPFLGYVIRAFLNQDNPFFAFQLTTLLHTVETDGSIPAFVKFWREFCAKHKPASLNLEIWVYEMLEFFYEIMSCEGFISALDVLIRADSFDAVSHQRLCDELRGTFIEMYFSRMFYPITYLSLCTNCGAKIDDRRSDFCQVCKVCRSRRRGYWSDSDEGF